MPRLAFLLALLSLAAAITACADEQSALVEPPVLSTISSTGSIYGDVEGPDGNICNSIPSGSTVRVDVLDPVNATPEALFAGTQYVVCPDNDFSIAVPAGTYNLRAELPRDPTIDPLPWRWLDTWDVAVTDASVRKDITVLQGITLGGTAMRGPYWAPPVFLSLSYDLPAAANFVAAYGLSDGLDGTWTDRATGGSQLRVQGGLYYRASCADPWPGPPLAPDDVGFRLLVGAPSGPFLFPGDVDTINCWYDDRTDVPGLGVDANNYQLVLRTNGQLGTGFFRDGVVANAVVFGGGVAYTTDPQHTFFLYDPSGATDGNMLAAAPIEVMEPGYRSDHWTRTVLKERPGDSHWNAEALDLLVVRETFAWETEPDDDFIIFKYTLFNPTNRPIKGLTAGQVVDHDLTDLTWWYARKNHVWFGPYDGDQLVVVYEPWMSLFAAHAVLREPPDNYRSWFHEPDAGLPEDPASLSDWWKYLSLGIVAPGPGGPGNVRSLLGVDLGTIGPMSTAVFVTALAGGHEEDGMAVAVAAARAKGQDLIFQKPASIRPAVVKVGKIWPGGTRVKVQFRFQHPDIAERFVVHHTFCSGAQGQRLLGSYGAIVWAEFNPQHLDSWISDGDRIICVGRLSDGGLFGGSGRARIE